MKRVILAMVLWPGLWREATRKSFPGQVFSSLRKSASKRLLRPSAKASTLVRGATRR